MYKNGSHFWKFKMSYLSKGILVITNGFFIPENIGLDTKIMSLCGLESKLQQKTGKMAAILKSIWPFFLCNAHQAVANHFYIQLDYENLGLDTKTMHIWPFVESYIMICQIMAAILKMDGCHAPHGSDFWSPIPEWLFMTQGRSLPNLALFTAL